MSKRKITWNLKTLLTAVLIAAALIGLFTGKLTLADLGLGETVSASAQAGSTAADTERRENTEKQETTTKAAETTKKAEEQTTKAAESTKNAKESSTAAYTAYHFRSAKLLNEHFEKHGKPEMGFKTAEAYEKAASDVINNPQALHKTEKEDGDFVFYVQKTNEFVVLSKDGYIRTYFLPSGGLSYYNRQ